MQYHRSRSITSWFIEFNVYIKEYTITLIGFHQLQLEIGFYKDEMFLIQTEVSNSKICFCLPLKLNTNVNFSFKLKITWYVLTGFTKTTRITYKVTNNSSFLVIQNWNRIQIKMFENVYF